jgi:hypothetical protein
MKKETSNVVQHWLNEIDAARRREKDFRKDGERILKIYGGSEPQETPYNILYSNTETLLPALYSAVPRPVVQRRFKDEDQLGKDSAMAGARVLEFLVDTNIDGYETYDEGMRSAVLDGLLPGRGVTSIKYDADIGVLPTESVDDETPDDAEVKEPKKPDEYKKSELVCVDTRSWNRVYFGYAKKWSKVPWVAYEEHIDKEEAERLFGSAVANKLKYTKDEDSEDDDDKGSGGNNYDDRNKGERKTACIYQIWDKAGGKKIRYISPLHKDGYLKVDDDPLELTGFFNCPKPMMFLEKSNDLLPVALYMLYQNQATELNRLTIRINRIVEAIKARGIYDSELGQDIATLFEEGDNSLVPADKTSSLAAEKGLQNAIWFMPIEQLINTLTQLNMAREQCKRVIYEVTGISDIIRGSSVASETATAQNLKSQWGTLRLKRLQNEVQRYARDLLRMMLEVAATKFSEETWARMTGLPFVTTQKREQDQMVMQQMQAVGQQMQAVGQQPNPQQMQQFQALQAELQKPVWGEVLALLRDDMQRAYRIDIETNSTVQPEAVEDQKNIAEVMTALGQYLNGVTPLIISGAMPFDAAKSMMLAIVRRFRFGPEIEDYVKQMQAPKPPDDGKAAEQQAQQVEQQKAQAEAQQRQAEMQQSAQVEMAKHQREQEAEANKMALERERIAAERETRMLEIAAEREAQIAELNAKRATAKMEAELDRQTAMETASLQAAVAIRTAEINAQASERQAMMAGQQKQEADAENEAKHEAKEQDNSAFMQQVLQTQSELIAMLGKPKSVTNSKTGAVYTLKTAT